MKWCILSPLVLALSGFGQQSSSVTATTRVDINGHRVVDGPEVIQRKSPNGSEVTEKMQSVNGRMVPLERIEERVIRDDASGRVVERVRQRFDPQGNPALSTKETIEEQKHSDGSATIQATTYTGDINGRMQMVERSVTEARKSDSSESAETVVQRPTLNGSVETVERKSKTTVKQPGGSYQEESTTYRKDTNGSFYQAVRQTTEHTVRNGEATDNTASYERGSSGQLELHDQTVAKTITHSDGSKDAVVDIYGNSVPGRAGTDGLKLKEQQLIERTPGPNGTVIETLSVRRPTVSDPNKLGPSQQLSQTVCKGDCKP